MRFTHLVDERSAEARFEGGSCEVSLLVRTSLLSFHLAGDVEGSLFARVRIWKVHALVLERCIISVVIVDLLLDGQPDLHGGRLLRGRRAVHFRGDGFNRRSNLDGFL